MRKSGGTRRIWIAWETQRRSITLSARVGAELFILDLEHLGWLRYPVSLVRTTLLLFGNRGGVVFVQNPSMVLAAFATALKPLLRYTLIVDRHSNFFEFDDDATGLARSVLLWMSRFSIRHADLTIVTNREVADRFIDDEKRRFILPDPYPDLPTIALSPRNDGAELRVLFVSSWQTDEPIREVSEVCRILGDKITVFISGRPKKAYADLLQTKPDNFIPTGFLTDRQYFDLMGSVDCVLAVSTREGTLCCGAYEGVAIGKPLILNDEQITKDYFYSGAVYTNSTVPDLEQQFRFMAENRDRLTADVERFHAVSSRAWQDALDRLNARIDEMRNVWHRGLGEETGRQ